MTACTVASCVGSLLVIDDSEAIKGGWPLRERCCSSEQSYLIASANLALRPS